jgi:hypothetical protein
MKIIYSLFFLLVLLALPCFFAEEDGVSSGVELDGHGGDHGHKDVPAVIYLWCGQNKSLPHAAGMKNIYIYHYALCISIHWVACK